MKSKQVEVPEMEVPEMIDCIEALNRLHEYLKQQLTPELAAQVQAHLSACRPCLTNARFERNYLRMLEIKLKSVPCPADRRQRILSALRDAPEHL
jgi:anti-sigma factor (TIGR02949 family)